MNTVERVLKVAWFSKKQQAVELDPNNIPRHVAIIMDGNGRWAQKRGLPRTAGHPAGSEAFRKAADTLARLGVEVLTVYAFSTENWKRPADEVSTIMGLLDKYLHEAIRGMKEKNIRLYFFGDLSPLSAKLRDLIAETEKLSETTSGMRVNVCLNYGGRDELVRACRLLAEECEQGKLRAADISAEMLESRLYSAGVPDPDLLIRPGGEYRFSNFLLWQLAYTEFVFTDVLWPDFDEAVLKAAIAEYQRRKRRYGGIE